MRIDLDVNGPFSVKREFNVSEKELIHVSPRSPHKLTRVKVSLLTSFLYIKELYYLMIHLVVKTECRVSKPKLYMAIRLID